MPEWLDQHYRRPKTCPFCEALAAQHSTNSDAESLPSAPARRRLAYGRMLANQLALWFAEKVKKNSRSAKSGNGVKKISKVVV